MSQRLNTPFFDMYTVHSATYTIIITIATTVTIVKFCLRYWCSDQGIGIVFQRLNTLFFDMYTVHSAISIIITIATTLTSVKFCLRYWYSVLGIGIVSQTLLSDNFKNFRQFSIELPKLFLYVHTYFVLSLTPLVYLVAESLV